MTARPLTPLHAVADRIALALVRNCEGYCDRGRDYRVFHKRAGRLWDMACRAGVKEGVTLIVRPPMDARIARELARQREERRSA